ncbi:MAG: hypothetical protein MI754_16570 [Chromatiales bacterium]|nr:hypothetical protein [Chromatiales bacterium]
MRPSKEQMTSALNEANRMRIADDDPQALAKCFLYLQQRNHSLEEIFKHLEYFLEFGMPAEEHAKLLRLVEGIREQDLSERGGNEARFGL